MRWLKQLWVVGAVVAALALLASPAIRAWVPGALAQDDPDADAPHPAHVHAGTCADLDPNPLAPLNDVAAPAADAVGPAVATDVEVSITTIPLDLATLVATDHAINVHLSAEEVEIYIACGEIGGRPIDDAGTLPIGLRQQNDSGLSGIAVLTPNAADPTQTDVSIFLAEGLAAPIDPSVLEELATPDLGGEEAATPATEATEGANVPSGEGTPPA
jgi:hypothetical protein